MRAVIFTDVSSSTPRLLSEATLAEAAKRPGFEVCGFVTTNASGMMPSRKAKIRSQARNGVRRLTGERQVRGAFDLAAMGAETGLPILVPDGNVNDPAFIERLHAELRPDVLLSYFFTRILKEPILDSFAQAVNFHDGLLPHYGGLAATSHSVYERATRSGYTFHRMTPAIDGGAILVQGSVPVGPADTGRAVGRAKAVAAAKDVPMVIDMIEANDPGFEQKGEGSYFPWTAWTEVTTIDEPASLESPDIERRLRAFGSLTITIDGTAEHVTGLASAKPGDRFSFATADGHLRASRLAGIPASLIEARRRLRR